MPGWDTFKLSETQTLKSSTVSVSGVLGVGLQKRQNPEVPDQLVHWPACPLIILNIKNGFAVPVIAASHSWGGVSL